jgi:two-component system sensor histidine kinase RegB
MNDQPTMGPRPADFKRLCRLALRRSGRTARLTFSRAAGALAAFAGQRPSTTRMRHQTLLLLRWLAIGGQTSAVLFVHFVLGHKLPLLGVAAPIVASTWLNVILAFRYPLSHRLSDREATLFIGFDILQLATLLYFTGGLINPFAILFLAPVTIAAGTLKRRSVAILVVLSLACVTALALFRLHWPLPWPADREFLVPRRYEVGLWVAMTIGILFSAVFAWRVSAEANRMSDALAATEAVLAREQRLAAVGGIAAAAAHELGTPLATISVVARELEREVDLKGPLGEDVTLLRTQAQRCRDILNRLTLEAQAGTELRTQVALRDVLEEIVEPHRAFGVAIRVDIHEEDRRSHAGDGRRQQGPMVWRTPEIVHGLGNIVENAVDFARDHVEVEAVVSATTIRIRVLDDGPGFSKDVLDRLGEPFMSTRSRIGAPESGPAAASDERLEEDHGMGLGFFIAKTLLERTGARVVAGNLAAGEEPPGRAAPRGAVVSVTWPRSVLEAPAVGPVDGAAGARPDDAGGG